MKISAIFIALAGLALAGCGGGGNGPLNIPNPRITFVNAFQGVATANFEVGNDTASGVAYGQASQPIITNHGTKDVSAGETTFNDLVTLTNQLFEQDKRYTVLGWGGSGARALALFENDKSQSPVNTISVRAINGSPAAGNVDIYVTDNASGGGLPGTPSIANVAAGTASAYVTVPDTGAITIRVRVFAAGNTTTALGDTTFALSDRTRISLVTFDQTLPPLGVLKLQDNL